MTLSSTALVQTASGAKYMQLLCKHWSHNLNVDLTPEQVIVTFPRGMRGARWKGDAVVTMLPEPDHLECLVEASELDQIESFKGALARQLDRFSFCEAPLAFNRHDAAAGVPADT